ncbi:SDR family NAD(P)-dependent oxidoreductase [Xenorhabdus kozodoii]|uniref:3-ketoacyl-ACP reductase n=1 Tax=Xenorhabdus kozodoii TaxID=351676 RepID=A0A2D0L2U5_9GAMM|nr:SDR family oxidoreductase [Xenorhabdus kozodoii]PHM70004.1 hypothetical protein Xkoz_03270 [Xenorhabdus kozodoii]
MVTLEASNKLNGKVALVTGGSRGIGRAIVEKLALDGVSFIGIHYAEHSEAALDVADAAQILGAETCVIQANFIENGKKGSDELWSKFYQELEKRGYEGLDILINCAGIAPLASISSTNEDIFKSVLSVNLEAPFFLIQAALPYIREGGRIINVSTSLTRVVAQTKATIYISSKGAIDSLTLALAAELGARKITVNAIAPGIVDTDMNSRWLNEDNARQEASNLSVFSRVGTPDDISSLVGFLASDDSRWITGQVIDVSGGSCI